MRRAERPNRSLLRERLEERRPEVEEAALTRAYAISDPTKVPDTAYLEGLRTSVSIALNYGLGIVERSSDRSPPVPTALLAQARSAARNGVSLDAVLRRYFAGFSLLSDILVEEGGVLLGEEGLRLLLRSQAASFDRLLAAISDEYAREADRHPDTSEKQRCLRVRRLLSGATLDSSDLAYDLSASHVGLLAKGPGAPRALRLLAASLDRRLLLVRPDERVIWAWLGGRQPLGPTQLERRLDEIWPTQATLSFGEAAEGAAGWRLSHRQALAALPIAARNERGRARYSDVALLAAASQNDLLAASLRRMYLAPLQRERDGGQAARETLRAYLAAGGNVTSAANALGLSRRTVTSRLGAIERVLECPVGSVTAELETALRLEELDRASPPLRTA